jgi:hypothetical protein
MPCGKDRSRRAAERNHPGRDPGAKHSFSSQRRAAGFAFDTAIGTARSCQRSVSRLKPISMNAIDPGKGTESKIFRIADFGELSDGNQMVPVANIVDARCIPADDNSRQRRR